MQNSNTFTTKISPLLAEKLKQDLQNQGFIFVNTPYALVSARKEGITCILYESGSLVVQGKNKNDFIEFYLEPELLQSFDYSHPEININMTPHIGVDESGKGDFFGPLCIASLYADKNDIKKLITLNARDSKKMTDSAILKMANILKKEFQYDVISIYPFKYNELYQKFHNLNYLLGWGHATTIFNLHTRTGCKDVFIDQFADKSIVERAVKQKKIELNLNQQHKGESDIVVAAASIVARSCFVEGLKKLEEEIGIELPKGASAEVIKIETKIATKLGIETLKKISKTHFKTYTAILTELETF